MATNKKVMTGEKVVIITLPEPAKPYLIPTNEETIKAIFKTELLRIYLRLEVFSFIGILKK